MASKGVNKVILVGNLGNDPDFKVTGNDLPIASISVATSESWKDRDGNKQERTEWHRVKFFGPLADIVDQYLRKGDKVYIEGKLRTEKYTDKDGIDRWSTDIIADEMQMLGGGRNAGNDQDDHGQQQRSNSNQGRSGGNDRGGQQQRSNSNQGQRSGGNDRGGGQQRSGGGYDRGNSGGQRSGGGGYNRNQQPAQRREPAYAGDGDGAFQDDDCPF